MARPVWTGVISFGLASLPVALYSAAEVKMAHRLVDALTTDWDPEAFHGTLQGKVRALIEAKAAGETVEKAEPAAQPTGVVDLMKALRASVDRPGRC